VVYKSKISSDCLACHEIHLHLHDIFCLITNFMQLCSNDVCQLNIFYVSHLNISILFNIFIYCMFFFHLECFTVLIRDCK